MSPQEFVHRAREQAKRRALRREAGRWDAFDKTPVALHCLPAFAAMIAAPRSEVFETVLQSTVAESLAGGFSALGQIWPAAKSVPWRGDAWLLDPATGKTWPGASAYAFDVEYRHNPELGDVKYVWEANRLQFLQPIAMLAPNDPKLARFAIDSVLQWMDANPPFTGVNWTSGIELALRLVSLAVVVAGAGYALTDEEKGRFGQFIAAHASWLGRFPSLYSSANNHRVAEGLGLAMAALLAPDLPGSSRWLEEGASILKESVGDQFHEDGVGVEQSPTYSAFTLEMLCVGALLLRNTGHGFDEDELAKLARATIALGIMFDTGGLAPRIGDDDEGRVIGSAMIEEPRYVASVTSLAWIVCGLGNLTAHGLHDQNLRDGLAERLGDSSTSELHEVQKEWTVKPGSVGGYTFIRDRVGKSRFRLVFDHGPLGFGGIAAHGHADALAVWLAVDGRPVLVDAGTYLYHSGGAWRDFFRSTAAHNTMEIAGLSQSVTAGAFNWRHKARARLTRRTTGAPWQVEGTHDGYRARLGVDHVRTLTRTETGFLVKDGLIGGKGALPVAIRFLVHPDLEVAADGDIFSIQDGAQRLVSVKGPDGMKGRIVRGEGDAIGPGWYSPSFGKRVATSCIVFEGAMKEGETAVTELRIGG